ncbi:Os09g0311200 [Oryza sativa Japonica Group]|uniref:Os09g0311200 protein n=1 Tax=Oryza sativa subsp. japonica TaxID=39947 RepID=A0A0N7KQJ4_ORYSJ|nr:Os09g0311200 [Oryza sativa Japonica Group]
MPVQRFEDLDEQYFMVNLDDDDFSRPENHHQDCVSTLTRTLPNLGTMPDELPIPGPMPSKLLNTGTYGTFAFLGDTSAPSSSSSNPAESTDPSDGLGRNQLEVEVEVLTKEQKLQAMVIVLVGQKLDASVKHV